MNDIAYSIPFSQLIITGERVYTTDDEIRQAVLSVVSPKVTFATCNIHLIQKKIKCLPWIKQVSVRKQWPDKINIYIVEYVPVACWNCLYTLLNKDAVIFTIPQQRINKESLPILFGPMYSEKDVLVNYYIFSEILKSSSCKLKSVSLDSRYSWAIVLENNVTLILGRKHYIARLQRFNKFYPIFLKKYICKNHSFIDYIDLRYKSGFSVRMISRS